jgi:hypothetical protein
MLTGASIFSFCYVNSSLQVLVSCWFPVFYQFHALYPFKVRPVTSPILQDVLGVVPALSSIFSDMVRY